VHLQVSQPWPDGVRGRVVTAWTTLDVTGAISMPSYRCEQQLVLA